MKLLLLLNPSASSVTARARVVIRKALSADHEVTVAETSRRGHALRLAQDAAAGDIDTVVVLGGDGTLNEAANGLAGTDTALGVAARRLDQRVRPHHRHGRRPHRGRGPAARRARARLVPAHRPRLGERPLLPLPRRHGLRRRGGRAGRAPGRAQALRGPSPVRLRRLHHLAPPLRPRPAAPRGAHPRRRARRRRLPLPVLQLQPLHLPRHPAPQRGARRRPRAGPRGGDVPHPRRGPAPRPRRRPRSARAAGCAGTARSTTAPICRPSRCVGTGPFPYQVDGDYLGETEHLEFRHEPDALTIVQP